MRDEQAQCAHCKVVLKHIDHSNGTRSDYWECSDGCGTKFITTQQLAAEKAAREQAERKYERLRGAVNGSAPRDFEHIDSLEKELARVYKVEQELKQRAESAEKACTIMRSLCECVDAAVSEGLVSEHMDTATKTDIYNRRIVIAFTKYQEAQINSGRDYIHKSKLQAVKDAMDKCVDALVDPTTTCALESHEKAEALTAAEAVMKGAK